MSVKTVIVGCGAVIRQIYKGALERLQKQRELTVVGLVDSHIENAREMQATFPGVGVFADLAPALDEVKADLTIVSSPAAFHAKHTLEAFQQGSHVLCEKPLAHTPDQCRQMVEASRSSGLLLGVEMTRRFFPSLARLKRMIVEGEIGSSLSFTYREGGAYNWPVMSPASFHRETGGGGVLADKGSHVLDTMLFLFGPFSVLSYRDDAMIGGVEGTCMVQIKNEMMEGTIQLSWEQELNDGFKVYGPDQEILLDPGRLDDIRIGKIGQYRRLDPDISFPASAVGSDVNRGTPKTYNECIYYQLVQVLRAIRLEEPIPVTGEEGSRVISAISECYKLAQPFDMPWLSNKEAETYKRLFWRNTQ
ncbi:MAG: Gfo/Idh/MocA family oxidoreductase [Deltaproteobacteria bacterium]|nr:Gfo/Idh/MocA family oxidoreductase [Deltaproteobacteria bacterium]